MRVIGLALLALMPVAGLAEVKQPYAGQDTREIAGLSAEDIAQLLAGSGWGLALPAELNGYPGPAHVLEAVEALGLSETQRAETQAIWNAMNAEARRLGARYVEVERHLSEGFAGGDMDDARLKHMTERSGAILAELRQVHLSAHLRMKALLSAEQVAAYDRLRGYGAREEGSGGHTGGHKH